MFKLRIRALFDVLFFALILAAPLVVFGLYAESMSIRLSRLLIILTVPVALCIAATQPNLFARDKLLILGILPYLIYTSVSAIWSPSVETGTTWERLGGLYEVVLLYLIFVAADLNAERFLRFVKFYVLSAVIPLAFSVWQLANNFLNFSPSELPFESFLIPGKYELLEGRVFTTGEGFSRVSSTFAEPVIFSSYICSVILMSLIWEPVTHIARIVLRGFQIFAFVVLALAVSKLSLLCLFVGLLFISIRNRKYGLVLIGIAAAFGAMIAVMAHYDLLFVFERLLEDTGHGEKLQESLDAIEGANVFIGEGIGSIPFGSWHRLVVSRVYESGLAGLFFVVVLSAFPFVLMHKRTRTGKEREINNICAGVLLAVLLGLHLYDFFIHLFPWLVIGAIASYHNSEKSMLTGMSFFTPRGLAPAQA